MDNEKKSKPQIKRIMTKASILFWEKGYTETSMRDIAGACGFQPANIYNFFSRKEEILFRILHEEMLVIIKPVRHLLDDTSTPPIEQLRQFIANHIRLTLGARRSSKLLFDMSLGHLTSSNRETIIKLRDEYDSILRAILIKGKRSGVFGDIDEKIISFNIASMIARSRIWYSPKGDHSIEEIINIIINFTLKGILKS